MILKLKKNNKKANKYFQDKFRFRIFFLYLKIITPLISNLKWKIIKLKGGILRIFARKEE